MPGWVFCYCSSSPVHRLLCVSSTSSCAKKAWGHTAHRGWARLLLNRARDLAIHDPAHRGANGAAMPTDEGDQDGQ